MKRAIVLSGGGGKGAYQIGVWKALRRLHIGYQIVTGTSVGALNGVYMVQRDYHKALFLWNHMNFGKIYDQDIKEDLDTVEGKKEVAKMYAKGIVLEGGMNVDNLDHLISETLNEYKFRKSSIDYGLVTFNLSKLKAESITKKEIPYGQVKDYMMASATCYPVFKKKEIESATFIDGGIYDNLPINLAIDMGADDIIAVDLKAVGIKQKVKDTHTHITVIAPKNKLNSFLVFDSKASHRAIHLGYNDAMKVFHKLEGNLFTFKKGSLEDNYMRYQKRFMVLIHMIFHSKQDKTLMDNLLSISAFNKIFKKASIKENQKLFLKTIEHIGTVFEMDETRIYDMRVFNKRALLHLEKVEIEEEMDIDALISKRNVKNLLNTKNIIKYIYVKMEKELPKKATAELCSLALLLSKDFLAALYLYTITKKHDII